MKNFSIKEFQEKVLSQNITVLSVVEEYLQRIKNYSHLNAVVTIYEEDAIALAEETDKKVKNKEPLGKLFGITFIIKDNINIEGKEIQTSSNILKGYVSPYDAHVIKKIKSEGGIILGNANCDEFAMGSSNEHSAYGGVKNNLDEERVPGGSSGGSTVAVSANLCHIALGTDTGGSVRQPASFCGIYGMKPTYSRISRFGIIAYSSSFDQVGILGKSISDIAFVLEILAGNDPNDSTSSSKPTENYSSFVKTDGFKVGYLTLEGLTGVDDVVVSAYEKTITDIKKTNTVERIKLKYLKYCLPLYYILTSAEASSNLARYNALFYGKRSDKANDLESTLIESRSEGFGMEVKRRIMLGTFVLSYGYYDAYYKKAQKVRRLVKEELENLFTKYDVLLLPTAPNIAFKKGEKSDSPLSLYLQDLFTLLANVAGIPAINVPMKSTGKSHMPTGIQVLANKFEEKKMLSFADSLALNQKKNNETT